jgi:hypothetical protein
VVIVVFISFIMSIFVAIQDPIIQKFAIRIAGGYISQKTGADIRIGRLYISPNFTIQIDHFMVKDLKGNDLLNVEELKVRPVMEDLIHGKIHIGEVELNEAQANLITYEGEEQMNLQFLIDAFSSDKEKDPNKKTEVYVDQIVLRNLDFQFWNQNKDKPERSEQQLMDYSHLVLDSINLNLENLAIQNNNITAQINHLAASEVSGFKLNNLSSQVNVSPSGILLDSLRLKTPNSDLHLDLHMLYNGYQAFKTFVDSVQFDTKIYPTDLMVSDLGPFTEKLYEMPDKVHFEGWLRGPVKDFKIDGLDLKLGKRTHFVGDIALQPMNLKDRVQVLNIKRLDYDYDDLTHFYLPIPSKTIPLPPALASLGHGTISGQFNGSMNKFKTSLNATSEIGNVSISLNKRVDENRENVFEGMIQADRLNVGLLANAPKVVGTLDVDAHVSGRQTKSGDFELDIDGAAYDAELLGSTINEIVLDGNLQSKCFNGKIRIDDDELGMNFNGRFDFSDPKALGGDFKADIAHADLYQLHLVKDDKKAVLKGTVTANMKNINKFNEAEGSLTIDNVAFTNSNGDFAMKQFKATIVNDNLFQKRINANCDFFDFNMAGKMNFNTLGIAFKQYIYNYVEVPQWTEELEQFEKSKKSSDQDFIVELKFIDPKPLTQLLMPSLNIAKNTTLNGTFTTKSHSLNMTLRSNSIKLNNIMFNTLECKSLSSPRRSVTRLSLNQIVLRDSTATDSTKISLDRFHTTLVLQNDSIKTNIVWDDIDASDHNKATIHASFVPTLTGGRFNIASADIVLNDSVWTVAPDNYVEIDEGKIKISNVALMSRQQSLVADGYVPMDPGDTLSVAMNQFNLSTLNFLTAGKGLNFDGFISGDATVSNLKEDPTIIANLGIEHLGVNGQTYGDAVIFSQWNNENNAIDLQLGLIDQEKEVINLGGSYYTKRKDDNLDFKLATEGLNIGILSPFLQKAVQRLQGYCTGSVDIKGSLKQPNIQGSLKIVDGGCKINFLNTYYTFSPTISLTDRLINLSNFSLTDTLGNSALVSGSIMHHHLKNFVLDIKLYPKNFLALATNAETSPSFYGTAIANGVVKIQGPVDNIDLDIKAMTRKGTSMTIPLGGKSNVAKHEFITFVDHSKPVNEEENSVAEPVKKKSTGFNIHLDLNVNNDAQVKIALPNNLGSMEARGEGAIKLGLPSNSSMSLIGDYVIHSGSLALNIQDMLRRNFALEPGSSISWTGDPVNGIINATGVYQTKASLSSLGLIDSTNMSSSNVRVDCMVHLKNKLLNPDITFGLRLPKASEDMQMAVFNVIDTTNQAEVLVQTLYLMLFNSFNYGGSSSGYTGFISNQLNDIISQFTNDIDINVNYKPGDDLSNEEMTVAMRKQLFDDRLTIETNFGVIIPTSTYASNSTNIVGDFNIDYKITKDGRLSGQVFNRSNYNTTYYQYTYYKMAPYTQGIGLTYSKNFDTFGDLFRKRTNTLNLPNRPIIDRPAKPDNPTTEDAGANE